MLDVSPLLLYGIPLLLALWVHARRRRGMEAAHASTWRESREAGLVEPPSMHPVVDPAKCFGSGACEKACPEKALGVVGGKMFLVNPSACIGHGACAAACPTQAITLVFGTERRGIELPMIRPDFETNVAGLFIAGELGGMGLIRKAAEQGRQAVETIARRERGPEPLDLVIVGAGPAGLAASLAAKEKGLRYVTLEQENELGGSILHYPRAKVAMTAPVKLPIVGSVKMTEISKEALLEFWKKVVASTRLAVRFGERMEALEPVDGGWEVRTGRGAHRARNVLLALGRRGTPRKLGVPGEELSKVVYRLLEPAQFARRRVMVVGGGDSALEVALAVEEVEGTDVVLCYRGEAFNRVKVKNRQRVETAAGSGRLRVMLEANVARILPEAVEIEQQGRTLRLGNDAVIVCAGGELPTPLLRRAGVAIEVHHGTARG
jgi:thioredoxin reductase (NADPH)